MANHKSAKKRIRQTARRLKISKPLRSQLKSTEKTLKAALSHKDAPSQSKDAPSQSEVLKSKLSAFYSSMDRAVRKGVQHQNKAQRKKSQMAMMVNQFLHKNKEAQKTPAASSSASSQTAKT